MTLKLGFESTEEILGLAVSKPDIKNIEQDMPMYSDVSIVVGIFRSIREGLVQLEKQLDSYCYLVDTTESIKSKNSVTKSIVKSIDEIYPDLLGTVAHINDFTDIPTKTGLDILTRFLDGKVNEVKDQILVTYTDSVFKYIEKLNTVLTTIDPTVIKNEMLATMVNVNNTKQLLMAKKCLTIFKDGVLHRVIDSLFTQEYRDALKLLNIQKLDMASVDEHIVYIQKLIELLKEISPEIDSELFSTYGGLINVLCVQNDQSVAENIAKVAEITSYIVNEKKLITEPATYRDTLVSKILVNPYLLKMDKQIAEVAKYLIFKALASEVIYMNSEYLNV